MKGERREGLRNHPGKSWLRRVKREGNDARGREIGERSRKKALRENRERKTQS